MTAALKGKQLINTENCAQQCLFNTFTLVVNNPLMQKMSPQE